MNRELFFAALRKRDSGLFGTSLSQKQVDGLEAVLDESALQGADVYQTAYVLGTGYGETGGKMRAVRENLNYSASAIAKHFGAHRRQGKTPQQLARNPQLLANTVYGGEWGRKNLGNILPDDGWDFRGFGLGQWTGRANTMKAGNDVGLNLVENPALLDDVKVNAKFWSRGCSMAMRPGKNLARMSMRISRTISVPVLFGAVSTQKNMLATRWPSKLRWKSVGGNSAKRRHVRQTAPHSQIWASCRMWLLSQNHSPQPHPTSARPFEWRFLRLFPACGEGGIERGATSAPPPHLPLPDSCIAAHDVA